MTRNIDFLERLRRCLNNLCRSYTDKYEFLGRSLGTYQGLQRQEIPDVD